jgi:hypothetical protein
MQSSKELLRDSNCLNKSSSRVVIMMESTGQLEEELAEIMRTECLHVNPDLLDSNDFNYEGKMQKSSVFEHRRYYEAEILNLKNDLECI